VGSEVYCLAVYEKQNITHVPVTCEHLTIQWWLRKLFLAASTSELLVNVNVGIGLLRPMDL